MSVEIMSYYASIGASVATIAASVATFILVWLQIREIYLKEQDDEDD